MDRFCVLCDCCRTRWHLLEMKLSPITPGAKRGLFLQQIPPQKQTLVLFRSWKAYSHQGDRKPSPHFPPHTGNALPIDLWSPKAMWQWPCSLNKCVRLKTEETLTLLLDYSGSLPEPRHRRGVDRPSGETVSRGRRRSRPSRLLTHWETWQEAAGTSHISTASPQGTIPHSEPQFWEPAAWQATPKEGVWTWISDWTFFSLVWGFCCYFSFAMCKASF